VARRIETVPAITAVELVGSLEARIFSLRGSRVMLSFDLAQLYDVETRVLMQAVRRNADRFPRDFMFELTREEAEAARSNPVITSHETGEPPRSQTVILDGTPKRSGRGSNVKYLPFAFTEQGVAMLSSVFDDDRTSIGSSGGRYADRVQELHIKVIHLLIELTERALAPQNYAATAAH